MTDDIVTPIEVLIGWTPYRSGDAGTKTSQIADFKVKATADVDDLAAWLRQYHRGLSIVSRSAPAMDGLDWSVSGGGWGNSAPRGATILAALEAAVRKVSES